MRQQKREYIQAFDKFDMFHLGSIPLNNPLYKIYNVNTSDFRYTVMTISFLA